MSHHPTPPDTTLAIPTHNLLGAMARVLWQGCYGVVTPFKNSEKLKMNSGRVLLGVILGGESKDGVG
jgi:hypothetical protein